MPETMLSALYEFVHLILTTDLWSWYLCPFTEEKSETQFKELTQDYTVNKWQLGFKPQFIKFWNPYCLLS